MTDEQVRAEENVLMNDERKRRSEGGCKKYGSDKCCCRVALLFPSAGVVLSLDNPCQTAVGDRDQIEMTDWSAAQTLYHTHTHTQSNEKEIKKAFCRKKRQKEKQNQHSLLVSTGGEREEGENRRLEVLCSVK